MQIKKNPNNPRIIKDDQFKKLVKSIQDFPQMMELRPIVVNDEGVILGGNMRFEAAKEALKGKPIPEEWIRKASDLTEEQQREFIIKDNVGFGQWDFDMLANEWDAEKLTDWGAIVESGEEYDMSLLDSVDDEELRQMEQNVKTALQIEFNQEDYIEAKNLSKDLRDKGVYLGGIYLKALRNEQD